MLILPNMDFTEHYSTMNLWVLEKVKNLDISDPDQTRVAGIRQMHLSFWNTTQARGALQFLTEQI